MANQKQNGKYAYLDRLSTEQLQELLRADIDSREDGDTDVIFHVLEVIEEREKACPTGILPEEGKAWAEFQEHYNTPEGEGLSLYPSQPEKDSDGTGDIAESSAPVTVKRRYTRQIRFHSRIAVALIATCFTGVIAAQAAGFDILGAIGRWTEETFQFAYGDGNPGKQDPKYAGYINAIQEALAGCGIPKELSPTWFPAGYETSKPEVLKNDLGTTVNSLFQNNSGSFFIIQITQYNTAEDLALFTFEKDKERVEEYANGQRAFYILSNLDNTTATWSDANSLLVCISGLISVEDTKAIIDSMGGY